MSLIVVAIWGLMLGLAFLAPPLSLLIYGLVGADRDGYSILQVMNLVMGDHKLVTRGIFVGLYCFASFVFLLRAKKFRGIIRGSLYLVQLLSLFIFVGALAKGYDVIQAVSILVFSGLPVYVIWVVFSLNKSNRTQFYLFVVVQIVIALGVLTIPSLDFLNGAVYKAIEGIGVGSDSTLNSGVPDASYDKGAIGKYANFHNPNALGFYSCAAIVVGIGLLIMKRHGYTLRLFGLLLGLIGGIGWLNSLTRGPMILLIIGIIATALLFKGGGSNRSYVNWIGIVLTIVGLIGTVLFTDIFSYLVPDASNISVTTRLDGYLVGLNAISQHPILGVGMDWEWPEGGYPHLLPLAFAADYGIYAGISITLIVFLGGAMVIRTAFARSAETAASGADMGLAVLLVMIVWGAALSNNLIAPVLFWLCFAEANITVFGVKARL